MDLAGCGVAKNFAAKQRASNKQRPGQLEWNQKLFEQTQFGTSRINVDTTEMRIYPTKTGASPAEVFSLFLLMSVSARDVSAARVWMKPTLNCDGCSHFVDAHRVAEVSVMPVLQP